MSLLLAALHIWRWRHFLNVDGISYLDVGDAHMAGDFAGAITGHWSPLYSWLLALGHVILRPSMYWEIGAVHLVNFSIFVANLFAFDFLLREVIRAGQESVHRATSSTIGLPAWGWLAIGSRSSCGRHCRS